MAARSTKPAQTLTYSLSGGADQAKFSINASTGALSFVAAPNFEVPTDVVHLTLAAEQEGPEPTAISNALSSRTQAVLAQAKRTSGVEAQSGGFTIHPNTDRNGRISTWRGRSEVILKSTGTSVGNAISFTVAMRSSG